MSTTARDTSTLFLATFPGRYYHDPTIYEQEQARIFSSMWVYAAVALLPEFMK
jgi:hypothetical protein